MRRSVIRNEEELNQILTNSELDDAGKAQAIKELVGNNFVPTSKYNAERENTKAQISAYKELKSEYEDYKTSRMTDEEKQAEQAKKMQEKYQKANLTISKMYAENTFAKAGFKEEDYSDILNNIVSEDPDKTKGIAETICNAMVKQKENAEKALKDKIVKNTKTPPAGNDNDNAGDSLIDTYKKGYAEAAKKHDFTNMAYYTRLIQEEQNKEE